MTASDSTERFSSRVADYVRYRPDYPAALIDWLHGPMAVPASARVADIGAGTGISSRPFLASGHPLVAVEPNAAMRAAAEQWLAPQFPLLAPSGTRTPCGLLAEACGALGSAAQAFGWWETGAVRAEWQRILHAGGLALVYWNSRLLDASPFLIGYEQLLLDYGTDYTAVAERYQDDATMQAWFGPGLRGMIELPNVQHLDFDALRGRLLSSSYAPQPGHPRHAPMLAALQDLFNAHAVDGQVAFEYRTRAFLGTLD